MALDHYVTLGNSGLRVSPFCLGAMTFGQDWGWGSSVSDSEVILARYIEKGGNFIDTANIYTRGHSEAIIGDYVRQRGLRRDQLVIATKFFSNLFPPDPNAGGAGRKSIIAACEGSLRRLQTDYIDLYWMHLWDRFTPIEETMEALPDGVKAGKVLYLGASSMFAWQFTELQMTAERSGWTKFVSMQNHYNLIYREEEREMNPYCLSTGVALQPWSPLARGILAGAYQGSLEGGTTDRSKGQDRTRTESLYRGEMDFAIAARVITLANERGCRPAQIAMAWLLSKPGITAPVVGVSRVEQLEQLVEACSIELSVEDVSHLEELYQPVENLLSIGTS